MVTEAELVEAARVAREFARAPFSAFRVGAALLGASGRVWTGCNVESASYSLTCCAERVAIFKAVSEGEVAFLGLVFEDTDENARDFLKRHGSGYSHLVDPANRTAIDYGIAGVPETFFIDAGGIIRDKHVGPLSGPVLQAKVEALKQGKALTMETR